MVIPAHQIRALYTADTITVYQAYPPEIALPALEAGRFVPPFKRERMTWIKPSFLWMMYRCGWASKPGQEVVLAVETRRNGFEWALANACLSHFDRDLYPDHDTWARKLKASHVRVQWDPERSLQLAPLPHRSIQIGLSGEAVDRYINEWIVGISDVTGTARAIKDHLRSGDDDEAAARLPAERPYPLPSQLGTLIGATPLTAVT